MDETGRRFGRSWGRWLSAATGLLVLAGAATDSAMADMVLSEVVVDLQSPDQRRHDVEVWNDGEETLYVEVKVIAIRNPEAAKPERVVLEDPRNAALLATPNRLAVAPGDRKRVRLVVREAATDRDLVYRVAFAPVENPAESDEQLAFKVLVGYEALVIVRPPGGRPELRVVRRGKRMRFENQGNSSLLIRHLEQCPTSADACQEIAGNRLYAGEIWDVQLPHDVPVRVYETFRSENSVNEY